MAKHNAKQETLPATVLDAIQESTTPAVDVSLTGTVEPVTPAVEPAVTLDASGRPNPYLDGCNARWSASTWAGHTKRVGNAGGPGTGRSTDSTAPSRCYGCNAPFRGQQQPVNAADGFVWHALCATLKDGGPGLPEARVQRAVPARAAAPAADVAKLQDQVAQLAALVAQLTAVQAPAPVAEPAPAEEPAA